MFKSRLIAVGAPSFAVTAIHLDSDVFAVLKKRVHDESAALSTIGASCYNMITNVKPTLFHDT